MGKDGEKNKLLVIYHVCQILFVIIISCFTAWNSFVTYRSFNLINRPFIGVTDVATTRSITPGGKDTYANTNNIIIKFSLQNTGNIPAKDVNLDVTGKIGKITLPRVESSIHERTVIPPHTTFFNLAVIDKNTLRKIAEGERKVLFSIKISYSDFEGYKSEEYTTYYELILVGKEPPNFTAGPVGKDTWDKTL